MKQALACFDFDGTMLRGDSIASYLRFARRKRLVSFREMAAVLGHTAWYFLGGEDGNAVKTRALRFRAQLSPQQSEALDREFVQSELLPRLYPDALSCWRAHRAAGRKMLLVSASTDNYMRFVADALHADALLCSRLMPDGRVEGNCRGEEKVRRVRQWLGEEGIEADLPASFAYGDSASDLPLLSLVGHPVQVNPKKKLRDAAPGMARVRWSEKAAP